MFNRLSTTIAAVTAAAGLLLASFLFGYGLGRENARRVVPGYELLREAEDHIARSAVKSFDRNLLVQGAIRGMLKSLDDPYAAFLDRAAYLQLNNLLTGHFSGVGLVLRPEEGGHKVVSVLADTPASKAGVAVGDYITAVDGQPVEDLLLDEVVQRVQGKPGTTVRLFVRRGDQTLDFTLTRSTIEVPSVESVLLKDRLGVIEVVAFVEGTGDKVRRAVESLGQRGARGLILDLRGNPGGLADEAVEVTSAFIEDGPIVSFRERGKPEVTFEARGSVETDLPLVVLVDEGSASASEIVAGAIQDRGRGIIVGTETYGKGSVQTVFPLSDGSALKITTASYFTPSGRSIGEHGVIPDVGVAGGDMQLARARQILREMVADAPTRRAG